MLVIIILASLLIYVPNVTAHSANVKGYSDKNSQNISFCSKKYYGYHKQNGTNHWHEVKFNNEKWEIVDATKKYNTNPCEQNTKIKVSFVRCVDGDTAVLMNNGNEEKYRFLAVDTPESVHPTKDVEAYAKEASKNTCDLLTNASTIFVEYDSNSDKKDKYGRNLVWIWLDDVLLQELMINEGFARVAYIYGNYKYVDKLCFLQGEARTNNKGIWQYGYDVGYCGTVDLHDNYNDSDRNNTYVVTFKDFDNTSEVIVADGMKVRQKEANGKTGYKFVGWYHNGKRYDFNKNINSNMVLEAKYKIDYLYIIIVIIVLTSGVIFNNKGKKNGKSNKKSSKRY